MNRTAKLLFQFSRFLRPLKHTFDVYFL